MKELKGGWINKVNLKNGVVVKEFASNGAEKPAAKRLATEIWALKNMPYAPNLFGSENNSISMQYLEGEKLLDRDIRDMPEAQQHQLLFQFGQTLRKIHEQFQADPDGYNETVVKEALSWLDKVGSLLVAEGVDIGRLSEYIPAAYQPQEKLVMTHGDYWLNNFIAEHRSGEFTLNGVIDWEMGRVASPYEDFALVELSTERPYGAVSQAVWEGYGSEPDRDIQRWFSIRKTLEWMAGEGSLDLSSQFYQDKIKLMKDI